MKKLICLLLAVLSFAGLAGCKKNSSGNGEAVYLEKITVNGIEAENSDLKVILPYEESFIDIEVAVKEKCCYSVEGGMSRRVETGENKIEIAVRKSKDVQNYELTVVREEKSAGGVEINNTGELINAIENQKENTIYYINDGLYDISESKTCFFINGASGYIFPVVKEGISVIGVGDVCIYAERKDGRKINESSLITVAADNVKIKNICLHPVFAGRNLTTESIRVTDNTDSGKKIKNFTAERCEFSPNTKNKKANAEYGGIFSADCAEAENISVKRCLFQCALFKSNSPAVLENCRFNGASPYFTGGPDIEFETGKNGPYTAEIKNTEFINTRKGDQTIRARNNVTVLLTEIKIPYEDLKFYTAEGKENSKIEKV